MTLEKLFDTMQLRVECKCGWRGHQDELLSGLSYKYCPKCGEQFRAWPSRKTETK
jgi:hypothetical protein